MSDQAADNLRIEVTQLVGERLRDILRDGRGDEPANAADINAAMKWLDGQKRVGNVEVDVVGILKGIAAAQDKGGEIPPVPQGDDKAARD